MNLQQLETTESVTAVVLFGSAARQDADAHSDTDILVLCNCSDLYALGQIRNDVIVPAIGRRDGVCCYRDIDFRSMARKGSLFLWHLKLQGRVLISKTGTYESILETLRPYDNYEGDLKCYAELLADVTASLRRYGALNELDLSILFTIARNACILLCYHEGTPEFGRSNPYLTARRLFDNTFPLDDWVYPELCSWKLWYERGVRPQSGIRMQLPRDALVEQIRGLLEFTARKCTCKTC